MPQQVRALAPCSFNLHGPVKLLEREQLRPSTAYGSSLRRIVNPPRSCAPRATATRGALRADRHGAGEMNRPFGLPIDAHPAGMDPGTHQRPRADRDARRFQAPAIELLQTDRGPSEDTRPTAAFSERLIGERLIGIFSREASRPFAGAGNSS